MATKLTQIVSKLLLTFVLLPVSSLSALAMTNSLSNPVGLLDVYHLASEQDAKLAQARAQYQADQLGVDTAFAVLLPQIKVSASYLVTDSSIDTFDVNTRDISLILTQSIYQHKAISGYQQVKQSVKTSKFIIKLAEQDLILRVTESYFKVLLAEQILVLFQAKEAADKTQLDHAQASANIGLASRVDVLQAKSSFDLSKYERINAENGLDISQEELTKLTGQSHLNLKRLAVHAILPAVEFDIDELQAQATIHNLAVLQAESSVRVADYEVELQKGGYWPTVNFQAKITDTAYSHFSGASFEGKQNSSVGITVSLPLYSGGSTNSKVSAARFKANAARQGLRDNQEQARLNARVQVRNLLRDQSLVEALTEASRSNVAFVEAAKEGYRIGLTSLFEVLTAHSNQYVAKKNLLEAIHNQVLNNLRLESTLGDLTTDDLLAFDQLLNVVKVW